ncbi:MAG: HIT family protein [Actinobacteria bacterium]|nr:HIT family protein [Actinomycetota bacterium]
MSSDCLFCRIAAGTEPAAIVAETEHTVAFLDHRPIFPGHTLVVPRDHVVTLRDLPDELIDPFFREVRRLAAAVQDGMDAQGTFVAENNIVSQSVAHLHVHVVPRRRKDGLRGFFWPRTTYTNDTEMLHAVAAIQSALPEP